MKKAGILLLLGMLLGTALYAQQNEEEAVKQTIVTMFDAMRAGDSSLLATTFHPEMTLKSVGMNKEGQVQLRNENAKEFLKAVGTPHDIVWDERILSWEIRIDGPMATAWTEYQFYAGERFSHCGVNAFQLIKQNGKWTIFHIADTRRKEGCLNE
ncbi:nuclear transport factor 2 family protein [Cytophagales bacterium LB-30]|uniref:Nuclear transport factor 2 family protein n=1 Tax=Shiella aurantiaca TaxID=3058365 RepID=A0ABT8F835_9BACT|nr:nuclear transport factor 2 family protein [Shiella aurantiaca]MDN4166592.1 nuclear transport factor 2 family protein [Shiella aurantiaca]